MTESSKTIRYLEKKQSTLWLKLKLKIKKQLGWLGTPQLILYRGYATTEEIFLTGHLTEDKGLEKPKARYSVWENALSMLKRYSSDNLPEASVKITVKNRETSSKTNAQGLFHCRVHNLDFPFKKTCRWENYTAELPPELQDQKQTNLFPGEFLIPGTAAQFGIISDIDDTIIVSHSTQTIRKLWLILFRNSHTRKPFPGVDAFYRALARGAGPHSNNPFFYVSSSEWNLYDLLDDFCRYNQLPKGVFLLRELQAGIFSFRKSRAGNHEHKYRKIRHLFQSYPQLHFVLIGDNGQRDPEIYSRISSEFPGRVKAIYIRTVRQHKSTVLDKTARLELQQPGVPFVMAKDSIDAARHAARHGLILTDSIPVISRDAAEDKKSPFTRAT